MSALPQASGVSEDDDDAAASSRVGAGPSAGLAVAEAVRARKPFIVFGPPWRSIETAGFTDAPVNVPGLEENLDGLVAVGRSLTPADKQELAAVHEAGHAVLYRLCGVEVTGVRITLGQAARHLVPGDSCGYTRYEQDEGHRIEHLVAGHLAGGVAAEVHLARIGRAEPSNLLLAQLGAASDHSRLLDFRGPVPLVFSYGPPLPAPDPGLRMVVVEIDPMREAVAEVLDGWWPVVEDLAGHLLETGQPDLARIEAIRPDPAALAAITRAMPA